MMRRVFCIAPTFCAPMPHRSDSALNLDPWYAICNTPHDKYNMPCLENCLNPLGQMNFSGRLCCTATISRALREGHAAPRVLLACTKLECNSRLVAQTKADHAARELFGQML